MKNTAAFFYRLICLLLLPCIAITSFAQSVVKDTSALPVYKFYMSSVGGSAQLYNGTEYTASYPQTTGTPFWDTAGFRTGIISYDGVVYRDIPIAFDLVANEVVIKGYQQLNIRLDASRVNFFMLGGHLFVRLSREADSKNQLPEDFYDLVYNGRVKVYVKRKKQVEQSFRAEDPNRFAAYNAYFIYKDNTFYPVTGKNALLKVFRDKSDAVKTFWKNADLNFRTGMEDAIIKTAAHYDLKD